MVEHLRPWPHCTYIHNTSIYSPCLKVIFATPHSLVDRAWQGQSLYIKYLHCAFCPVYLHKKCTWVCWLKSFFSSSHAAYTYFYKGKSYWRFDNHKTEADKGYPRSILKDFMGCVGVPDPKPDPDIDQEPKDKPVKPTGRGKDEHKEPDRGQDKNPPEDPSSKPDSTEDEEDKEVNVVVTVADNESKVMTLIMVTVPLVLILCILILIYAILRTLQNKETPRALVHCKRSLQDWVWDAEL